MLGRIANRVLRPFGYRLTPAQPELHGLTADERDLIARVRPFTMTSIEQMLALIDAVKYVTNNNIPGAFVECGVWRGGSMMLAAEVLLTLGSRERDLYLYDNFAGMPPASPDDVRFDGLATAEVKKIEGVNGAWCLATEGEVRTNLSSTHYPNDRVHIVAGDVGQTLPANAPRDIAILRLDTDWYGSTKHELFHLYPRLAPGGVLILDDYGYWRGCKKAVDEYFRDLAGMRPMLQRVDDFGRIAIKP